MNIEEKCRAILKIIENHSIDVRNEMNDGRCKSDDFKTAKKIMKLL
jgi:hypothetical protein